MLCNSVRTCSSPCPCLVDVDICLLWAIDVPSMSAAKIYCILCESKCTRIFPQIFFNSRKGIFFFFFLYVCARAPGVTVFIGDCDIPQGHQTVIFLFLFLFLLYIYFIIYLSIYLFYCVGSAPLLFLLFLFCIYFFFVFCLYRRT